MAVITELIEAGTRLKRQGNLRGAIEHFRQLHTTYPGNARIMFELAGSWTAFGVPEQALPLYRELLALPKGQGLPPKDLPRLYTYLGATLRDLGELDESLAIIEEGLRLHPSYRPLRAWRIFSLASIGSHPAALVDAMELMLESLAPSRWDIFEDEIIGVVKRMRARLPEEDAPTSTESAESNPADPALDQPEQDLAVSAKAPDTDGEVETAEIAAANDIPVMDESTEADEIEISVNVRQSAPKRKKKKKASKKKAGTQMGRKSVRIDIRSEADGPEPKSDDDESAAAAGSFKIPIDPD